MLAGAPGATLSPADVATVVDTTGPREVWAASAESLVDEAVAFARSVADARPLPLVRNMPCKHPLGDAYFQFARNMVNGMSKNFPAPAKCVDAVQAATKKKFDDGMAVERDIFVALMSTPESKALRHIFLAERAASKIPDVPSDTPIREIKSIAVIGASEREGSVGAVVLRNLKRGGFNGPLWCVNSRHGMVDGERAWPNVESLPEAPDLAVICTPPASVPGLVSELAACGARAAIVLTAGLDAAQKQAMLDAARPRLLRLLGPNCIGVGSARARFCAAFNSSFEHVAFRHRRPRARGARAGVLPRVAPAAPRARRGARGRAS